MGTAPPIRLLAIAPMLCAAAGAIAVLLGEAILSRRGKLFGQTLTKAWIGSALALTSALALALALGAAVATFRDGEALVMNAAHPMIRLDAFSTFAIALIALMSLLICGLSITYLAEVQINHGEYYALILLSSTGMMFFVAATDLILLFLGLELMSIPLYVLAGFDRSRLDSNESALKYFLVGSFASAILLYGMALLYGASGALGFAEIRAALPAGSPLALIGVALIVAGFAFKIAAVPFHQWAPDVYQGAPVSVTAYMAVAVKLAAFAALLRILIEAFPPLREELSGLFAALAVATVVVGNVMALIQNNLKRLLAYSSIAHAGYLLIGLATGSGVGYGAVLFYLFAYAATTLGAFAVLVALANRGSDCERIEDLAGLGRSRPALAALLAFFAFSLAGIPGTVGFVGKFAVFRAAVQTGYTELAIVGVLGSVVSVYYYLRLSVLMYMHEPGDAKLRQASSPAEIAVLGLCAAATLFFGIFPNGLGMLRLLEWAQHAAARIF